jgi:hypothetical protein
MQRSQLVIGLAAAMLVAASSAYAGGINFAWQNCAALGGLSNRTFACNTNAGSNAMIGTFVPASNVAQVAGIEAVVDLISQQATLPDWWAYFFVGACRRSSLSISAYNGDGTLCVDWAGGMGSMNIVSYVVGGLGPNTARIKVVTGIQAAAVQDLLGGIEYGAFNLTVNNQKTVGTGACAGCLNPVCIVFNSCKLNTAGNLNNQFLGLGTSPGSNIITWQGAGAGCSPVPVKAATWGQVKALYR